MIFVADIGGTKIDAAMIQSPSEGESLVWDSSRICMRKRILTRDFSGVISALQTVKADLEKYSVKKIALALAGPVFPEKGSVTNLNWQISAPEILREFNASSICLMNDLEAHAYGVIKAERSTLTPLNSVARNRIDQDKIIEPNQNMCVIAPGTGLGEAFLFWDGENHRAIATEGAHASFAPVNEIQQELLKYAWTRHQHVSVERVVSGSLGLPLILDFFCERHVGETEDLSESAQSWQQAADLGAALGKAALENDPVATDVIQLFIDMLASEAGNLALKGMSSGGVFVTGAIAKKLKKFLTTKRFEDFYSAKGRFQNLLKSFPLYLLEDDDNAIRGLFVGFYIKNQKLN